MKKTVIIGASSNPSRYAYIAARFLMEYNHEIVPVGNTNGSVFGREILDIFKRPAIKDVHTVTMYICPRHQPEHYDYILGLKPKRIIFNPGAENDEFIKRAEEQGVEVLEACTLVMLRSLQY